MMGMGAVERMVVALIGDGTSYDKMIKGAIGSTEKFTAKIQKAGTAITAALTVPLLAAGAASIKQFADYEQAIAGIKAAANPTAAELEKLKSAIEATSRATGVNPAETAKSYGELVKAGVSVKKVLGGVGETVAQFAKVGGLSMEQAAQVIINGMTQFGSTADEMANILSQAADASTASIADVVAAFGTGGGAMKQFGQTARDTATAIALLANANMAGAEAGTGIKSMFVHMLAGGSRAEAVIKKLNLQLRDASGNVKQLPELLKELEKFKSLAPAERDKAMFDLFGTYGFRAAQALMAQGVEGFKSIQAEMTKSLTVTEKFNVIMDTFWGRFSQLKVEIAIVAEQFGKALAPALDLVVSGVKAVAGWLEELPPGAKTALVVVAGIAAAIGPVILGIGVFIGAVSSIVGVVSSIAGAVGAVALGPLLLGIAAAALVVGAAIAAVALAVYGFVKSSGGWAGAWKKLESAANGFIEWIRPIWKATMDFLMEFWPLVEQIAEATWEAIRDAAVFVFDLFRTNLGTLLGDTNMTWTQIRDTIVDALEYATFAVEHFGEVCDLVILGIYKKLIDMADTLNRRFTLDADSVGMGTWLDEMTLGLGAEFDKQDALVKNHFEEWKKARNKIADVAAEAGAEAIEDKKKKQWQDAGKKAGEAFNGGLKGEIEKIDAMLVGSAEALSALAAHRERVGRGAGLGGPIADVNRNDDQQMEEHNEDVIEQLEKIVKNTNPKQGEVILEVGLGGT